MNNAYTFTLKSFRITDTRSVHEDSDYVSIAVAVGSNSPITVPTKSMGDLNNGTYQVNLSIPNVVVPATAKVAFSYPIVNSGFDKNKIEQSLRKAASDNAGKAASAIGDETGGGPVATAGITAVLEEIEGVIFANCDGIVAAANHVFTGAELAQKTAGGKAYTVTDDNKGTDSPHGCGRNSHYFTTWSITSHAV